MQLHSNISTSPFRFRFNPAKSAIICAASALMLNACATPEPSYPPHAVRNPIEIAETVERLELYARPEGFELSGKDHPIIPVMLGDAELSQRMARRLFELGVYVSGFFYPVVPMGKARIRTQMNAALTEKDIQFGLNAFATAGKELGIIT